MITFGSPAPALVMVRRVRTTGRRHVLQQPARTIPRSGRSAMTTTVDLVAGRHYFSAMSEILLPNNDRHCIAGSI
jgi:hypothetical protein